MVIYKTIILPVAFMGNVFCQCKGRTCGKWRLSERAMCGHKGEDVRDHGGSNVMRNSYILLFRMRYSGDQINLRDSVRFYQRF
jgi:hypothetical protein